MSKAIEWDQLPKEVVEYVQGLEKQLNGDITKSIIQMRDSLKLQIDNISSVLLTSKIYDLSDADDKTWERVLKLSTDSRKIVENLLYMEGVIAPKVEAEAVAVEGTVESYVKLKKETVK